MSRHLSRCYHCHSPSAALCEVDPSKNKTAPRVCLACASPGENGNVRMWTVAGKEIDLRVEMGIITTQPVAPKRTD